MKRAAILVMAALVASPALGKTKFEALETREPMVFEGKGGTKITKNGIDYWTAGNPPRRHQVLGIIKDNREDHWLNGNAIGSKAVARLVKQAGGDAVVVFDSSQRDLGMVSGGSTNSSGTAQANCYGYNCTASSQGQAYGQAWSRMVTETTTVMIVVKYLPDEPQ